MKKNTNSIVMNNVDRYAENQIYLLKDGTYAWVTAVTPKTTINYSEEDRFVEYIEGKTADKNLFDGMSFTMRVDNVNVTFNVKKRRKITITGMRIMEAWYAGVPDKKKQEEKSEALSIYFDSEDN